MIRTLPMLKTMITLAAVSLLAGCVTGDYAYRSGGRGDYYYGQPSTEYRYYGYGSYGYPYGGAYGFGSRYGYGYPYGYGGYPYYPYHGGHHGYPYYRPRPPYVIRPPRPDDNNQPPPQHRPDGRPPWRDLEQLRRRQQADGSHVQPRMVQPQRVVEPAPAAAAPRRESGSPRGQMIRRSVEARGHRESGNQQEP